MCVTEQVWSYLLGVAVRSAEVVACVTGSMADTHAYHAPEDVGGHVRCFLQHVSDVLTKAGKAAATTQKI